MWLELELYTALVKHLALLNELLKVIVLCYQMKIIRLDISALHSTHCDIRKLTVVVIIKSLGSTTLKNLHMIITLNVGCTFWNHWNLE